MITELRITDRKNTPIEWWDTISELARRRVFKFKEGLNVLTGPNGSGKSSILKAIGTLTHCVQGGVPKVTQNSVRGFMPPMRFRRKLPPKEGMQLVSDGQPVHFFDPDTSPGLFSGGAAFDYDFLEAGIGEIVGARKASSGQATLMRLGRILQAAKESGDVTEIPDWERYNSLWRETLGVAVRGLKGTIPKGQKTILLDEPGRSLDLINQVTLWAVILRWSQDTQIIVASHSPLAFGRKKSHYVETVKGYRKECEFALDLIREHLE